MQHEGFLAPGGDDKARGNQCIRDLEITDQRQIDLMLAIAGRQD